MAKFSMLTLYEMVLVMSMYLTLCHANSAGTGIPCSVLDGNIPLGHPKRGDLQAFQDAIDAAATAEEKTKAMEDRVEHMHKLESEGFIMYWTLPAVHSARYTVRSGDGSEADVTEYTPGSWMNIYVRALDEGEKFTGLVMNAVNNQGNMVGDWIVDPNSAFRYGEDASGLGCVTHRNAELKHYRNVFRFKVPEAGVGTIKIRAMVKVGLAFPVLDGNFYWGNDAAVGHLTLTEGSVQTQTWFEGAPGQSCDEVCSIQGGTCDLETLSDIGSSRSKFYSMAKAYSPNCMEPIMTGCGPATPSVGSEGCFFHDKLCGLQPTSPPLVRKDPCEGLQEGGNGQLTGCIIWSYQIQNNPPGRDFNLKDGGAYEQGDRVKVCNVREDGQSTFFNNQDSLGNGQVDLVGRCAPPGGYTPAPTPIPPPAKVKGDTTCSATDSDPSDGGRICACTGVTNDGTNTNTNDGPNTNPTDDTNVMDDSSVSRSSPNMALVGAVVLLTSMNQFGIRMPKFMSILSFALSVNAHNWMSSPSRANNNFNAYQTAPCPPKGARVHFQVQAGQKFPMEFATGHSTPARGGTYLTVLRAEDEPQMIKHTRALLDDYIANAPTAPYMAEFKSHHVGSTAGSTTGGDVSAQLAAEYGVGAESANIRNYGSDWRNKPPRAAPIYRKTESATSDDIRVKYKNDNYPWIISCHKFKLHEDKSEEADLVLMEIPEGSPKGQYVIQYSWNGYYDCTDVNVIDILSTDLYGFAGPANPPPYDKLDHCLWNPTYDGYTPLGQCKEIKKGDSARACFDQCTGDCYGVQVVPYKLPEVLGKKGMFQNRQSTMPQLCNNLQNIAEDSLVCFALKQGSSVVGSNYDISDDPYDSVFYGTCYIQQAPWKFDQPGPTSAVVSKTDQFKFGGQECISCDTMRNNEIEGVVPFWEVTFGVCEHCNRTLG